MRSIAYALPALPGFAPPKTYATWRLWRDSTTQPVKFGSISKKDARRAWWDLRRFERHTRMPGRQDGSATRNGLAIYHALVYEFFDDMSAGRWPSYAALARAANISIRSVARGLAALKRIGAINWLRRARPAPGAGRGFILEQDTNAYALLPVSQWRGFGFWRRAEPPAPDPTSWGAMPPLPDQLAQAVADRAAGDSTQSVIARLTDDPGDELACALARLGRTIFGEKS